MAALAVDYTISKIVSLLENEASLLGGIRDEFHEIKRELVCMKSFLEDADQKTKACLSEGEKAWIDNVRHISYDVEDIIDELEYRLNMSNMGDCRFTSLFHKAISFPKKLWLRHCVGSKLRHIKNMIRAIPERQRRYGVKRIEGNKFHDEQRSSLVRGESSLFLSSEELVGIEDQKNVLLQMLMDREEQHLKTIAVVGTGGSGKTTLVAQAYNSLAVKQNFDCCAWICVSQRYSSVDDLLRNMIREFHQFTASLMLIDLSTLSYRQLIEMLVNFLKPLRYIIVLDDVWNVNLWSEIRLALPDNKRGSRILLTARREDVGSFSLGVKTHVHHIQLLGKDKAWDLFCSKTFSNYPNNQCPSELEILAKDMVAKCQGIPLAIVALAGLMTTKKLEMEWRRVCGSFSWELNNNPLLGGLKSVLMLSFDNLPYLLKRCFLYCCIFPEDCWIRRKRIVRLWMAEGFVEVVRGLTPEEVAESYLIELGYRGMLEVVKNPSGRPKGCKMHDLMRELARSISEREEFCFINDHQPTQKENEARRLSTQMYDREIESWRCMPRLRSFFVFSNGFGSPSSLFSMPSGFKLLRVLEMEYVPIYNLSSEVGNLINLRYLNLKGTRIQKLPKSIGRLHNLQTLNLFQTRVKKLPSGIMNLRKLRYLISCYYNTEIVDNFQYANCTEIPTDITKLRQLQVLSFVKVNDRAMRYVENLTQLTCLGIEKTREVDERTLCSSIEKLQRLCHLSIKACSDEEVLSLDALPSPPPQLRRLNLVGKLEKVPHWFRSLNNLRALYLSWSRLDENPLFYIRSLPNLRRLTLVNAYAGDCFYIPKGFLTLKSLILHNFPSLNEIVMEKGGLQGIQSLWLFNCMALKTLPHGIEHLTNLQQINLKNVSRLLIESIRREESVDRLRAQHISKINYYYQTPSGWNCENLALGD